LNLILNKNECLDFYNAIQSTIIQIHLSKSNTNSKKDKNIQDYVNMNMNLTRDNSLIREEREEREERGIVLNIDTQGNFVIKYLLIYFRNKVYD